ncbi:NAD-dependent epimerase/dehydratase family protein [Planctomycetota bacterium]
MAGTSILQRILAEYPTAKINAAWFRTPPAVQSDRITCVQGDLRDLDDCRRMATGCDCAIMAAAYTGGAAYTSRSPFEHMRENLLMNRQMLEALHLEDVQRIVFIGSAVIYQSFEGNICENELDFNKDPHMAYFGFAWAMRFLEKMCEYLHTTFDHEIVRVRAANIYGPRDKFAPDRSNFIPAIVRKAVDRMDPLTLWGEPDVTRDVIYCDDFAKAVVMLAAANPIKNEAFNVGSGRPTTVREVVGWALKYAGHKPKHTEWISERPTTIKYRALDIGKLQAAIGWKPDTTAEQGVQQTVAWWQENKEHWQR